MKKINKVNLSSDIWGAPDGVASLALLQVASAGESFIYVARDYKRISSSVSFSFSFSRLVSFVCARSREFISSLSFQKKNDTLSASARAHAHAHAHARTKKKD